MKYYSFWFGLVSLACVGVAGAALGAKAQHMMETKADGDSAISIPTKRIFLDWGAKSKPTEHDYAFVTQGNTYRASDYIQIQSEKWLAYFDVPLNVLLAGETADVKFSFAKYDKDTDTIASQTDLTDLSYDHGMAFYAPDFTEVSRKALIKDIELPYTTWGDATYLGAIYNCVLADINPCDNSSVYTNYLGTEARDDIYTVWGISRAGSHCGVDLRDFPLDNSNSYQSNANGETVKDKLVMMYNNGHQAAGFVAAPTNDGDNGFIVTVTMAAIALGVSAAIFFGIRKKRDNA